MGLDFRECPMPVRTLHWNYSILSIWDNLGLFWTHSLFVLVEGQWCGCRRKGQRAINSYICESQSEKVSLHLGYPVNEFDTGLKD